MEVRHKPDFLSNRGREANQMSGGMFIGKIISKALILCK